MKLGALVAGGVAALAFFAAGWAASPGVVPSAPSKDRDAAFRAAIEEYRQGRMSAAYGRFTAIAQQGDADAARIALFMHRYGPTVYGKYWDIGLDELQDWTRMACGPQGRLPPQYRAAAQAPVTERRGPQPTPRP